MKMHRAQVRYQPQADVVGEAAPAILPFRNLPHAYEVTALGTTESVNPSASWARGQIVRDANPILSGALAMPPPTPMYDPTIMGPQTGYPGLRGAHPGGVWSAGGTTPGTFY